MNDIRTRVHTAAVVDALREVQTAALKDGCYTHRLNRVLNAAVVKADEAHACAIDDSDEADHYKRHAEMMVVAKKYYTLLDAGKQTSVELSDKLDKLLEPFSDDPAFTAFCQMKRAAAGLS
jgi:hypothetical protein